jgi:hypothetical protein
MIPINKIGDTYRICSSGMKHDILHPVQALAKLQILKGLQTGSYSGEAHED